MPEDAQSPLDPQAEAEVRALLENKQKIDAVKLVRLETGWTLKEALAWVELGVVHPVRYRPERKPCPSCGQPLRTVEAKQCFACGADWH